MACSACGLGLRDKIGFLPILLYALPESAEALTYRADKNPPYRQSAEPRPKPAAGCPLLTWSCLIYCFLPSVIPYVGTNGSCVAVSQPKRLTAEAYQSEPLPTCATRQHPRITPRQNTDHRPIKTRNIYSIRSSQSGRHRCHSAHGPSPPSASRA